ncbi:MAG: hypothetical protein GY704_15905, partial [Phycisphaeraceae bacterium]|nr:hypothetical protein [Phycisphaeraceae bacterium]
QRYRVTLLLATPTFLQLYVRRCSPQQFGSLRIVMAGAERLPPTLATAFDLFGAQLKELLPRRCVPMPSPAARW